MKKFFTALVVMLSMTACCAQAERTLYAAQGTISQALALQMAALLEETLGEAFAPETADSLDSLVMAGRAPALAIVPVQEAVRWAREGLLIPLDGWIDGVERMAQPLVDACVFDERLMAAPLEAGHHQLAVRADRMQEAMMGYLLDRRAHPVWYPSELAQALDELAMLGTAGMEVWPPREGESLYLEALLQGVTGMRLADEESGAYAADAQALDDALEWLDDMLRAGLIGTAESRQEALERFLEGETAIFPDWTAQETAAHAGALREEEILLVPYPSLDGSALRAAELIVLCAFSAGEEKEEALLARAVKVLCSGEHAERFFSKREIYDDGASWLPLLPALEYGPTLRSLLAQAAGSVMSGEANAWEAAQQIDRAMRTLPDAGR